MGDLDQAGTPADMALLTETVAARFASRFDERDRQYENDKPYWHNRVQDAVTRLRRKKLVAAKAPKSARVQLTDTGRAAVAGARERAEVGA